MGLCSLLAYPPAPGPNLASSLLEGLNDWPIYITPFRFANVSLYEALLCLRTHSPRPFSLSLSLSERLSPTSWPGGAQSKLCHMQREKGSRGTVLILSVNSISEGLGCLATAHRVCVRVCVLKANWSSVCLPHRAHPTTHPVCGCFSWLPTNYLGQKSTCATF